jgi:BirA family biotin operon repressor/biotin-[acetyl-CoA-carboxylase] ligase
MQFDVKTFTALPSTQDYVKELAEEGFPEGLAIQCMQQIQGRGRHGKIWESPLGNMYMSVLLRPECDANIAGQISFVVAVAMSKAIDEFIAPEHTKTLKWPNDILINGKKCAGILLESELDEHGKVKWIALGTGVNIMVAPEGAVTLNEIAKKDVQVPVHPFRDRYLEHLGVWYKRWQEEGFDPIREEWMANAHGLGCLMKVNLPDRIFGGTFFGIDELGALDIETAEGMEKVYSGEIVML